MTPAEFVSKWRNNTLSERAGAQAHFLDLCAMLGVPPPNDPENYCFERGATRTGSGHGWADVWKRGCFGWENKAPGRDLADALRQLMTYALALDNPPLLVVCDREIIQVHTHFTGTASEVHTIRLEEIGTPENLQKLRWIFTDPDKYKPRRTVGEITAKAASHFAEVAQSLTARGHEPQAVAHFLIQCLFCMFAEDVRLLPEKLFERVVAKAGNDPERLAARLGELFASMRTGGEFALETIPYFNGGLFETIAPIPLNAAETSTLLAAAGMDWAHVEPSIFGTLFERGLDPAARSQLGANYTDPATILRLIDPTITRPLLEEWETIKAAIAADMDRYHCGGKGSQIALKDAQGAFLGFIERLKNFRILDAACGSGNFLYLALRALKDLEHRANLDAEALGLHRELGIETNPANVLGIELNPYAAELARVTIWIGEIQWMLSRGYQIRRNPILSRLDTIECRDAVLASDGSEPEWPAADVIVGNPPFLGDKKMRAELGADYVAKLRSLYDGRVPGGADFVTYWFEKARAQIEAVKTQRAGLVATNSVRGGANRKVLDRICTSTRIFEAWSDEDWINEGAAVRVSLVCFGDRPTHQLDGKPVGAIFADLTASEGHGDAAADLTQAKALTENVGVSFIGTQKSGPFDIPGNLGRLWLKLPNPHGQPNSDVVKPWVNGMDITRRPSDTWVIDFGVDRTEAEAMLYEAPFNHVLMNVKPMRDKVNREGHRKYWWLHGETRSGMRKAMSGLPRYICTPRVSKHRLFVWLHAAIIPDSAVAVIARCDDATFGVLHSCFHELWSLRLGTSLEDRPRYTPTSTFETFPFPAGMTPRDTASAAPQGPKADAIAAAVKRLNELRDNWLNPAEWTERVPEVAAGFPDRIVPKAGHEADLAKRTLTNLYNTRPAWLDSAHKVLDAAVAAAYGWTDYTPSMPDAEILRRLLALNSARTQTHD